MARPPRLLRATGGRAGAQRPESMGLDSRGSSRERGGVQSSVARVGALQCDGVPLSSGCDDIQALLDHCDNVQKGWSRGAKGRLHGSGHDASAVAQTAQTQGDVALGSSFGDNSKSLLDHSDKTQHNFSSRSLSGRGQDGCVIECNRRSSINGDGNPCSRAENDNVDDFDDAIQALARRSRGGDPKCGASSGKSNLIDAPGCKGRNVRHLDAEPLATEEYALAEALRDAQALLQEAKLKFSRSQASLEEGASDAPPSCLQTPAAVCLADPLAEASDPDLQGDCSRARLPEPEALDHVVGSFRRDSPADASQEAVHEIPSHSDTLPTIASSAKLVLDGGRPEQAVRDASPNCSKSQNVDCFVGSPSAPTHAEPKRGRSKGKPREICKVWRDGNTPTSGSSTKPPLPKANSRTSCNYTSQETMLCGRWIVIGGIETVGIIVRTGRDLSSQQLTERLSNGAVVQEDELVGDRLHYSKLSGVGPDTGWVSVNFEGKSLLVRVEGCMGTVGAVPDLTAKDGSQKSCECIQQAAPTVATHRPTSQQGSAHKRSHSEQGRHAPVIGKAALSIQERQNVRQEGRQNLARPSQWQRAFHAYHNEWAHNSPSCNIPDKLPHIVHSHSAPPAPEKNGSGRKDVIQLPQIARSKTMNSDIAR